MHGSAGLFVLALLQDTMLPAFVFAVPVFIAVSHEAWEVQIALPLHG